MVELAIVVYFDYNLLSLDLSMVLKLSDLNIIDEWARSDKWNVRFRGDGPNYFTNWLPATNLSIPVRSISTFDWSSGHRLLSIPKAQDYPDISMTLIDDDTRSVLKFLRGWADLMFNDDGGVKYLNTIVKVLEVESLKVSNEVADKQSYIVFPSGAFAQALTSDSSVMSYSISFKVAGII